MKEYKHNYYIDKFGLYYIYLHIYNNRILYIGKGSRGRCGKLTDSRSEEYVEFLNSINKKDIKKYILCECYDEELILSLERLLHDELEYIGYKVYSKANGERIRGNKKGVIHKQNIQKAMKGKNSKPIVQLNEKNEFIREYPSISSASMELNVSKSNLCKYLNNQRKICGNVKWMYASEYNRLKELGEIS